MFGLRLYGDVVGPSFEVERVMHLSLAFALVMTMVAVIFSIS